MLLFIINAKAHLIGNYAIHLLYTSVVVVDSSFVFISFFVNNEYTHASAQQLQEQASLMLSEQCSRFRWTPTSCNIILGKKNKMYSHWVGKKYDNVTMWLNVKCKKKRRRGGSKKIIKTLNFR